MRLLSIALLLACLVVAISGCATSGSTSMIATAKDPIALEEVTVLMAFPPEYETIALLKCEDGGANFNSAEKTQNLCLKDLRERAAKVGANGLVLTSAGEKDDGAYLVPVGNSMVMANSTKVQLTGTAIRYTRSQ